MKPLTEIPLKELPSRDDMQILANRYPEFETSAVEVHLMLLHVATTIMHAATSRMQRHGITPSRFRVLILLNLYPNEGQKPSLLSEKSGVTRATVTSLIKGLEQDGYVERIHDKTDRREVIVRITKKGETFINSIIPGHFQCVSGLMSHLSERERKQLIKLLLKVQSGIGFFQQEDKPNINTQHSS